MSRRARAWTPGTPCWVDLASPDLDVARAFYGAVLGWEFEVGGPEYGGYTMCSRDGADAAGIGPAMSPEQPTAWTVYLATTDAAATAEAVTTAGGQVLAGPMGIPERGTLVAFTDPQGVMYGAWQPGPFIGASLVNEPGGLVWEDLRSPDPDSSRAFLSTVFGLQHDPLENGPPGYTTLRLDEPFPLGGVGPMFGSAQPHWLVYFGVSDVDAALATVTAEGGQVQGGVDDTPFGRMVTVTDPAGASFALFETSSEDQPDRS